MATLRGRRRLTASGATLFALLMLVLAGASLTFVAVASAAPDHVRSTTLRCESTSRVRDLESLTVDYGLPRDADPSGWNWDGHGHVGSENTRDACSLFDTDGDGFVNYASRASPLQRMAPRPACEYVCSGGQSGHDRCAVRSAGHAFASSASVFDPGHR